MKINFSKNECKSFKKIIKFKSKNELKKLLQLDSISGYKNMIREYKKGSEIYAFIDPHNSELLQLNILIWDTSSISAEINYGLICDGI